MSDIKPVTSMNDVQHCFFWLPFEAGAHLALAEDFSIRFDRKHYLPIFLCGADVQNYKKTKKVSITAHAVRMGILIGYRQRIPGRAQLQTCQECVHGRY
jgi:hypothetical protein